MHRSSSFWLLMLLGLALACNRPSSRAQGLVAEPYVPDSGSVAFDIEPSERTDGSLQFLANYTASGRTAKFLVELGPAKRYEPKDVKDFPMGTGEGQFLAVPGSDASVLLSDLKKALEATKLPTKTQRVKSLPFTFVNFGTNLSQAEGGGFNEKPPGNWTAMKIFLGNGDQEAEVFLNFNTVTKKGQFSIKDVDYGDLVLAQLAKVL